MPLFYRGPPSDLNPHQQQVPPAGGGPGGSGGGGGGGVPAGVARDLSLKLSADHQNLTITLTPNTDDTNGGGAIYTVFWLDPTIFSQSDIYNQGGATVTPGQGLTLIQGRKDPIKINGGAGIVSTTVFYNTDYQTGGWMYATVIPAGTSREYRTAGTNFVSVPVIGATGEPSEVPTNLLVQVSNAGGGNARVQFSWTNPSTLIATKYIKITAVNYWNDNCQRDLVIYRIGTGPGGTQGSNVNIGNPGENVQQSLILEDDVSVGAHNIDWYFVPMSAALTPQHLSGCPKYTTAAI